jgi:hypothetical protein
MVYYGNLPEWIAAVVAAGAAVAAAVWAKSSANSADRSARVAEAAERRQRRPRFNAQIEEVNDGGWHRFALQLTGPEALPVPINVELLTDQLQFPGGQYSVRPHDGEPVRTAWVPRGIAPGQPPSPTDDDQPAGMQVGQTARWRVQRSADEAPERIDLRITTTCDNEDTVTVISVDIPGTLRYSVTGTLIVSGRR